MGKFRKITLSFVLIATVILSFVFSVKVFAQNTSAAGTISTNNFYFKDFTADYYLSKDEDGTSRMKVVENLTAVFPKYNQNHGITRIIPYTNNDGKNLTMESDRHLNIAVTRNGEKEKISEINRENGYFEVYIGDANSYVHDEQKYTITYEFVNVILPQSDSDKSWQELYWDTNGNDWSQKFESLTARIHFDESIKDAFDGRAACYVGRYGVSTGSSRCNIKEIDGGIEFTTKNLATRENLTFVIGFKDGTFKEPVVRKSYLLLIVSILVVTLAIATIIFSVFVSKKCSEKRQYYKGLFVKPEYAPPKGYNISEMAENYIGKGKRGNPMVATLLELAVTGKIELIKSTAKTVLGREKNVWKIKIKKAEFSKPQATVLKILNRSTEGLEKDQEITLQNNSSTSSAVVTLLNNYNTEVKANLESAKLYEKKSKESERKNYASALLVIAILWVIAICFGAILLADILDEAPKYVHQVGGEGLLVLIYLPAIIATLMSSIIAGTSAKYYQHTKLGLEMSRYLEGLYLYIKMAEADRINFLQSVKGADTSNKGIVKLYEKLLPYASLFGLEKSWIDNLGKYYEMDDVATPTWYVGVGAFSAKEFSSALSDIGRSANVATHSGSSGSSSSGSGFSGGFSGGGGGGGGGGGW